MPDLIPLGQIQKCRDRKLYFRTKNKVTFILLVVQWFQQFNKLHINMDLHSHDEGDLQQHELELANTFIDKQIRYI